MGITSSAATMLCMALKQTFSRATAHSGTGHMTRSSISRVIPNSDDSGSATAAMPENIMATAISPGRMMVPKSTLAPPAAIGLPPPMRGRSKVNTNRNSSGCIPTRRRNGAISRLSTRRSRRNKPKNALKKIPESRFELEELFTQIPPREFDEYRFQTRFGNREIAQAKARSSVDQLGQKAVLRGSDHAQSIGSRLDAAHIGPGLKRCNGCIDSFVRFQFQIEDGLRTEGLLQLLRRSKRQNS